MTTTIHKPGDMSIDDGDGIVRGLKLLYELLRVMDQFEVPERARGAVFAAFSLYMVEPDVDRN